MDNLFSGQVADGDSSEIYADTYKAGDYLFSAAGTWATGTVTLKLSTDSGNTYIACGPDTTLSEDGHGIVTLPSLNGKNRLKATLSGGSAEVIDAGFEPLP